MTLRLLHCLCTHGRCGENLTLPFHLFLLISFICSLPRSHFVPQAVPGPGALSQMTWRGPEERLAPLPAWQVSLHVTASSQRRILGEHNSDRWKRARHWARPLLTSVWYGRRHVGGCAARPGMPSFDAGWDLLHSSASVGLFSPLTPYPHPLWLHWRYLPTVVCPHSVHATDARERSRWQIAFSRWFFEPLWHLLCIHAWATCSRGHSCWFFLFSYTNRWDGRGVLIKGLEQLARAASHLVCLLTEKFLSCIPSVLVGSHMSAKSYSTAIYSQSLNFSILFSLAWKRKVGLLKAEIWWVAALFPVYKNYLTLLWQEYHWLLTWDADVVVVGWTKYNIP